MKLTRWFSSARSIVLAFGILLVLSSAMLTLVTANQIEPVPHDFSRILASSQDPQFTDRYGKSLNITYQNHWNVHDALPLHRFPSFLKQALITSEDKRFYEHDGPDWIARLSAAWTNLSHFRRVRGASTITEQVLRMLRPRPRTLWSRWLEGFEASRLEKAFSKDAILTFYLNQVPFAGNRRGFAQAARYYFDRDVATLSPKETLALVVLVRAPSRYHLWRNHHRIDDSIDRLAHQLVRTRQLSDADAKRLIESPLKLKQSQLNVDASAFVRYVGKQIKNQPVIYQVQQTTLDSTLQQRTQAMLNARLHQLRNQQVNNGAALVADHLSGEILVWAVAKSKHQETPGSAFDTVTTARQPGSALKPFLYGLALEHGWTAATQIDDAPTAQVIGHGLHHYQNFSRQFYGPVTLRQALGNSLNIPALITLRALGESNYFSFLQQLGFKSLQRSPQFYGDGLALGSGEVTLLELVQAFSVLANQGVFRPLRVRYNAIVPDKSMRLLSPEVSSILADILSDPAARALEFGHHSLLNFPVQTAVKTGTSSDFRDSWALGFNDRYTVGVWLGNLDQSPTDGITGSTGPALLLRSIFAELNRFRSTRAFVMPPNLIKKNICHQKKADSACNREWEWFVPGTDEFDETKVMGRHASLTRIAFAQPRPGLHLAYDPRQPATSQAYEFSLQGVNDNDEVHWRINNQTVKSRGGRYLWPLTPGHFTVEASLWKEGEKIAATQATRFTVK